MESKKITSNHMRTDDLALSAYLKMKGHRLIRSNTEKSTAIFTFESGENCADDLKMEFINSEFVDFYNQVRNLKKLV